MQEIKLMPNQAEQLNFSDYTYQLKDAIKSENFSEVLTLSKHEFFNFIELSDYFGFWTLTRVLEQSESIELTTIVLNAYFQARFAEVVLSGSEDFANLINELSELTSEQEPKLISGLKKTLNKFLDDIRGTEFKEKCKQLIEQQAVNIIQQLNSMNAVNKADFLEQHSSQSILKKLLENCISTITNGNKQEQIINRLQFAFPNITADIESMSEANILHYFIYHGDRELLNKFLEQIDLDDFFQKEYSHKSEEEYGFNSPIRFALMTKKIDIAKIIIDNLSTDNYYSWFYLNIAIENNLEKVYNLFTLSKPRLEYTNERSQNILHNAIFAANQTTIEYLLKLPFDLTASNYVGENILHLAIRRGCPEILELVIQHLNKNNLNLFTTENYFSQSPLQLAADLGDEKIIGYLQSINLELPEANPDNEAINYNQTHIVNQLQKYLQLQKSIAPEKYSFTDPSEIVKQGECYGLSFIMLVYTDLGLEDEFYKILELISTWQGTEAELKQPVGLENLKEGYANLEEVFEQLLNDVVYFQGTNVTNATSDAKQHNRVCQFYKVRPSEKYNLTNLFSLSTLANLEQLTEFLEILKYYPNSMVSFNGSLHATSIYVNSNKQFNYYDPNPYKRYKKFVDTKELATAIMKFKYKLIGFNHINMDVELEVNKLSVDKEAAELDKLREQCRGSNLQANSQLLSFLSKKESPSANGFTPLHHAVFANNADRIKFLLKLAPEQLFAKDKHDKSPIDYAIIFQRENCLEQLLPKYVELEDLNAWIKTAYSSQNLTAFKMLIGKIKECNINYSLHNLIKQIANIPDNCSNEATAELQLSFVKEFFHQYPDIQYTQDEYRHEVLLKTPVEKWLAARQGIEYTPLTIGDQYLNF